MKPSTSNPLVSIIVPVYQVQEYIQNCLNSILSQTYYNWEAILVDDGSSDKSGEICDDFAKRDFRFKVLHKENGGQSSARNLALSHTKGDYIFFLDSDDFIYFNTLKNLVAIATEYDADIVQCDFMRGVKKTFPTIEISDKIKTFTMHEAFLKGIAKIIPCAKLYKREVIGNIRFPEGLINEDDFTVWKFYYNSSTIVTTPSPFYYYTVNPTSTMANKKKKPDFRYFDAYIERIRFFEEKNEPELVAVSRIQWMKSLVLTSANPALTSEQRDQIQNAYRENYSALYSQRLSFKIPTKLNLIFKLYNIAPRSISKLINKLYQRG